MTARFVQLSFILVILMSFTQCMPRRVNVSNPLLSGMVGRGPVPLSNDNPFVASNLFLSRQMEKSPELKGFITHKGPPVALEVQPGEISEAAIIFYYPDSNESYELEEAQNTWVIRGPFSILRDKQRQIQATLKVPPASAAGTVVALEQMTTKPTDDTARAMGSFNLLDDGTAKLTSATKIAPSLDEIKITEFLKVSPLNAAEITPKGDLVHYVSEPGELIGAVARWYTYDNENIGKLARINHVSLTEALQIGQSIVIPSYMVKNKAKLDASGLAILKQDS